MGPILPRDSCFASHRSLQASANRPLYIQEERSRASSVSMRRFRSRYQSPSGFRPLTSCDKRRDSQQVEAKSRRHKPSRATQTCRIFGPLRPGAPLCLSRCLHRSHSGRLSSRPSPSSKSLVLPLSLVPLLLLPICNALNLVPPVELQREPRSKLRVRQLENSTR